MTTLDLPERLRKRVCVNDADCWLATRNGRYAEYMVHGRRYLAHRFVYELFVGPIPNGLEIDHLCRNRPCINPAHLEAVTCKENIRRGLTGYFGEKYKGKGARPWRKRTHCPQGHAYTGRNLIIDYQGKRLCRACYNASRRRIRANKHGYNP